VARQVGIRFALASRLAAATAIAIAAGTILAILLGRAYPEAGAGAAVVIALGAAIVGGGAIWRYGRRTATEIDRLAAIARAFGRAEGRAIHLEGSDREVSDLASALHDSMERSARQIAALQVDRDRLQAILMVMDDGVIVVGLHLEVILMNRAAASLLDATPAPGQYLIEVVHDHEVFEVVRQAAVQRIGRAEPVRLSSSGRELMISAAPMTGGGSALLIVRDITDVRRAETIRRDFATNVSHELKTPIASLKALVETLEEGAFEDPTAARDFLARMHVEVDQLAQMVQEILDLARIESGRAQMVFAPRPPESLVASAVHRLAQQAVRAGIDLRVAPTPNLPEVRVDTTRLEGALVNLIHNALKFTEPGGRVVVSAASASGEKPSMIRFSVEDSGCGIAAADLPRIWERFYKADRSRSSSGTGLGLAIVKHVAQAHGGTVGVRSAVGEGSTFWIDVPAREHAESRTPPIAVT